MLFREATDPEAVAVLDRITAEVTAFVAGVMREDPGSRRGAENLCLYLSDPVVPGAELYPCGAHAALFDPLFELGKHPVGQFRLARLVRKGRYPRLAIDAGWHHDRKVRRLGDGPVDVGTAADADC